MSQDEAEAEVRVLANRIGEQLRSEGLPVMGATVGPGGADVELAFRAPSGFLVRIGVAASAAKPDLFRGAYRGVVGDVSA
jgi:hypothetical protein